MGVFIMYTFSNSNVEDSEVALEAVKALGAGTNDAYLQCPVEKRKQLLKMATKDKVKFTYFNKCRIMQLSIFFKNFLHTLLCM